MFKIKLEMFWRVRAKLCFDILHLNFSIVAESVREGARKMRHKHIQSGLEFNL